MPPLRLPAALLPGRCAICRGWGRGRAGGWAARSGRLAAGVAAFSSLMISSDSSDCASIVRSG